MKFEAPPTRRRAKPVCAVCGKTPETYADGRPRYLSTPDLKHVVCGKHVGKSAVDIAAKRRSRRRAKPFARWSVDRREESPMLVYASRGFSKAVYVWTENESDEFVLDTLVKALNRARVVLPKKTETKGRAR